MLSTTCEYALRALALLAQEQTGPPLLGRDIAQRAGVPANYLSKILNTLKRAGLVEATRGTGGGYWLARPPESIHLIEVVDLFDAARSNPACILGSVKECTDQEPCSAHAAYREVRHAFLRFLENTTLGAIATHPLTPWASGQAGESAPQQRRHSR
jgi:Rrf2 family protein